MSGMSKESSEKKVDMAIALAASFYLKDPSEASALLAKKNLEFSTNNKSEMENAIATVANALLEAGEGIEELIDMQFTFDLFDGAIIASKCGEDYYATRNNESNSKNEGWFILQRLKGEFGKLCVSAALQEQVDQRPFIDLYGRYKTFRDRFPSCEQDKAKAFEAMLDIFADSKSPLSGEEFKKINMFELMTYFESLI